MKPTHNALHRQSNGHAASHRKPDNAHTLPGQFLLFFRTDFQLVSIGPDLNKLLFFEQEQRLIAPRVPSHCSITASFSGSLTGFKCRIQDVICLRLPQFRMRATPPFSPLSGQTTCIQWRILFSRKCAPSFSFLWVGKRKQLRTIRRDGHVVNFRGLRSGSAGGLPAYPRSTVNALLKSGIETCNLR